MKLIPDEGFGDGQDGPDEPGRVHDNKRFQILPEPARNITHVQFVLPLLFPPLIFCQREQMFLGHDIISAGMMVGPSVDHLVAFLQPAQARHSSVGCGAVQVDYQVVLRHHQLQGADHIAAETQRPKSHE